MRGPYYICDRKKGGNLENYPYGELKITLSPKTHTLKPQNSKD